MTLSLLLLPAVVVLLTVVAIRRDPRWLGNAYLLGLCLLLLMPLVAMVVPLAGAVLGASVILVALLAPLGAVVLGLALIANGITMLRRERRSLTNLLSLVAGLGVLAATGLSVAILLRPDSVWTPLALAVVLAFGYVGGEFAFFLGYSWVYARIARKVPAEHVIVLGAGLRDGRTVGPLLAGRVDEGIRRYRDLRARGLAPMLVMSGGKGSDESVPEAQAMAEYAIAQGIPADHVLREEASRNTFENLVLSRELLQPGPELTVGHRHAPEADGGTATRTGHGMAGTVATVPPAPPLPWFAPPLQATMLIVTSDFHAMRAAMYARRLRLPAHAVGSRTAAYYLPSAVLREFIAVVNERRLKHLVLLLLVALPLPLLVLLR